DRHRRRRAAARLRIHLATAWASSWRTSWCAKRRARCTCSTQSRAGSRARSPSRHPAPCEQLREAPYPTSLRGLPGVDRLVHQNRQPPEASVEPHSPALVDTAGQRLHTFLWTATSLRVADASETWSIADGGSAGYAHPGGPTAVIPLRAGVIV